jgi:tight adherence protein B
VKRSVLLVLVAVAALVVGVPVRPAGAADALVIRKVDTTAFPKVRLSALFTGPHADVTAVSVRESGRLVTGLEVVPVEQATTPVGVVLAIDTSGSMRSGGRLEQAKAAARSFIEHKLPNDQIALVTFDNQPRVAVNFTDSADALLPAIDALQPKGETSLWDAVRISSNLFADRPDLLPYVVVLSDGADTVSQSSAADALGSVRTAQAGVFTVAITGPGESDVPALRDLAAATGGTFAETADPRQLGQLYGNLQRVLQNQYELRWTSTATSTQLDLTVQIADARATASVPVNGVSLGASAQPRPIEAPTVPAPLEGTRGPLVIAVLVGLATACLGSLVVLSRRERQPLDLVLQAYTGGPGGGRDAARADEERTVVPEAMRRAVERTAEIAGGGRLLEALDAKLDQADLKIRAQEAILFYAGGMFLVGVLAMILGGFLVGLSVLIVAALVPPALLNRLGQRRRAAFNKQLPDTLQLLASSLRAGYSLLQGIDAVAEEVDNPSGRELRRVVLETRLGRDMEQALEELAGRMQSQDFDWVVMAIRIQREVGGNLAELLTSVAETMISRERLRREVSALTAEGRLSAIIVGALPVVIGLAIMVLNPGYLDRLFQDTLGKMMLLGTVILTSVGFVWMKKTIQIDV